MSRIRQMIDISAPEISGKDTEVIEGDIHRCAYCSGNGWFWGMGDDGQGIKTTCPMCQGTGYLRPIISIKWKPINK